MDPVLTLLHLPLSQMLFAGDIDSAKSTTGFVILMGGGAVSWSSKLQSHIAFSTTEAELIAGESCTWDIAFFQYILEDLGYKVMLPQPLGMDNQSVIHVAPSSLQFVWEQWPCALESTVSPSMCCTAHSTSSIDLWLSHSCQSWRVCGTTPAI